MQIIRMKKLIIVPLVFLFILFANPGQVEAKRLLPRVTAPASSTKTVSAGLVGITVKFRSDRRAIVANFTNLNAASLVTYSLTYESNGLPLGAGGNIDTSQGTNITREILFGSCSKGVCRYDSGIKNAKFVVTSTVAGRKRVKTFRLKV